MNSQTETQIPPTVKINVSAMPKHETDALCRVLIRSVTEAFKDPAFVADYEEWRAKRYGTQPQGIKPKRAAQH